MKTRREEWAKVVTEKRKSYKGKSKYGLYLHVYFEVVKRGAESLMPLFESSKGRLGHISGQVDMQQMRNEAAMKEMGEQLAALSPNVMVKIPGSPRAYPFSSTWRPGESPRMPHAYSLYRRSWRSHGWSMKGARFI